MVNKQISAPKHILFRQKKLGEGGGTAERGGQSGKKLPFWRAPPLNTHSEQRRHFTDVKNVSWILIGKLYVCQGACVSSAHPGTHMVFSESV